MVLDDSVGNSQAETGAVTNALGREERLEDMGQDRVWNSRSGILDREPDTPIRGGGDAQLETSTLRHRLLRVHDDVEEGLLEEQGVGIDEREAGRELTVEMNTMLPERPCAQRGHTRHDRTNRHSPPVETTAAGEDKEVANNLRGAICLAMDAFQFAIDANGRRAAAQQLREAKYTLQRIVQLVRDARYELSHGSQLVGLGKAMRQIGTFRFEPDALGDVARHDDETGRSRGATQM